eukprot:jgi/Mesvir1/1998/Mv24137-RA.1
MSYPVVSLERLMPSETEAGTAEGFWLNLSGSLHNDFEKGTQGFIDKLGRYCLVFNAYDETLEDCHMNRIIDMLFHKRCHSASSSTADRSAPVARVPLLGGVGIHTSTSAALKCA